MAKSMDSLKMPLHKFLPFIIPFIEHNVNCRKLQLINKMLISFR
jgi:hypothetical protein